MKKMDSTRGGPPAEYVPSGPRLLYLSRTDLASLGIEMHDVVAAVDAACRLKGAGGVVMPPKLTLHGEAGAFTQVLAATLPAGEGQGAKWVSVVPANVARGLPAVNGLVLLADPLTGLPEAVMDAGLITAWRTGASVGVAARYLARADVECVGVLGCGAQGRSSVRALAAVLPELRAIRCHDVVPAAAEGLRAELEAELPGVEVAICLAAAGVARGAGVVVTAITMAEGVEPPLGAGLLEPGALAVALDYDAAWSAAAMAACERLYCDDTATVLATRAAGARLAGIPAEIAGDLGELASGSITGRRDDKERLFCLNLGMAVEDVVTARLALARARELGVGCELPL